MQLFCAANLIAQRVCGFLLWFFIVLYDPDFTSQGISLGNVLLEVPKVL